MPTRFCLTRLATMNIMPTPWIHSYKPDPNLLDRKAIREKIETEPKIRKRFRDLSDKLST